MKTLKLFGITIIGIMLIYACEKQDDEIQFEDAFLKTNVDSRFGKTDGSLELPFKAHFYTKRDYSNTGEGYCTEDPFLAFNYQVGEGEATFLGHFTTTMQFCGAGFDYNNGQGVLVAANGDELYFSIAPGSIGHVIPIEDPYYEANFKDPIVFTGGTGRFEGASGNIITDSYVNLFDDEGNFIPEHQTDHYWSGTLILPSGKD